MATSSVYDELKKINDQSSASAAATGTNSGNETSVVEDAISKAAKEGNWQSYYNGLIQNANAQRRARSLLHNTLAAQGVSTQGEGATQATALSNAQLNANNALYQQLAAANNQADQEAAARLREDQQLQQQRQWAVEDREASAALTREGWAHETSEREGAQGFTAQQNQADRDLTASENDKNRATTVSENQKDRDATATENDKSRTWQSGENQLNRDATASENDKSRTWQSEENEKSRQATAELSKQEQDWQSMENELERIWRSNENAASDERSLKNSKELADYQAEINKESTQRTWDREDALRAEENAGNLEGVESMLSAMSSDWTRYQNGDITESQYYANLNAYLTRMGYGSIDSKTGEFTPNDADGGAWNSLTANQRAAIDMYLIGYAPGTNSSVSTSSSGYTLEQLAAMPMGDDNGSRTIGSFYADEVSALNNMVSRGTLKSGDYVAIKNGNAGDPLYYQYNSDGTFTAVSKENYEANGGYWVEAGKVSQRDKVSGGGVTDAETNEGDEKSGWDQFADWWTRVMVPTLQTQAERTGEVISETAGTIGDWATNEAFPAIKNFFTQLGSDLNEKANDFVDSLPTGEEIKNSIETSFETFKNNLGKKFEESGLQEAYEEVKTWGSDVWEQAVDLWEEAKEQGKSFGEWFMDFFKNRYRTKTL